MNCPTRCILALILIPGFCLMDKAINREEYQVCEDVFEREVKGEALLNHVFQLVVANIEELCLVQCKVNEDCVSYNIGPSKETQGWFDCELSDSDRYLSPGDLKPKPGFSYRGKKNPCLPNPCKGDAECKRRGYDYSKYECVCPKGFTGENCEDDIDECADSCLHNCKLENPFVKCNNTPGSYRCICAEGYVGDGITCGKDPWRKLNKEPVCFGTKDDSYGTVVVPDDVDVTLLKLVHVSGGVSFYDDNNQAQNWGDNRFPKRLYIFITYKNNIIITPPPNYIKHNRFWTDEYGQTVSRPELFFPTFVPLLELKKGDEIRIWFGEDLRKLDEQDNYGQTCADLWARSIDTI